MMKKTLVAAVMASFTGVATAQMTAMDDSALSAVNGQDGVAIVANLGLGIGGITYTDNDGSDGSFTFGNISITGLIAVTIDILDSDAAELNAVINPQTVGVQTFNAALNSTGASGMNVPVGSDVVRIGIPNLGLASSNPALLTVSIGDMTMGEGASFGSLSIARVNPQGTTVYIAAKN